MTQDELKQLIKLQMKQASELLDSNAESDYWSNNRGTLFQTMMPIRKNLA